MTHVVPEYAGELVRRKKLFFGLICLRQPVGVFLKLRLPIPMPEAGVIPFEGALEIHPGPHPFYTRLRALRLREKPALEMHPAPPPISVTCIAVAGEIVVERNEVLFESQLKEVAFLGTLSRDWSVIEGGMTQRGYFFKQSARFMIAHYGRR